MKIEVVAGIFLVLLSLGIISIVLFSDQNEITPQNVNTNALDRDNVVEESGRSSGNDEVENLGGEVFEEEESEESGESGDSGGVGGSAIGSCQQIQIPYALKNFKEDDSEGLVNCSVEVNNLDIDKGGEFFIRFSLVSGGETKSSAIVSAFVGPREKILFERGFAEEGDCKIESEIIPRKEICG